MLQVTIGANTNRAPTEPDATAAYHHIAMLGFCLEQCCRIFRMQPPCKLHSTPRQPISHLHRDWAHPSHICAGTGLTAATSAPRLSSPLPHLHRDWARPSHICTATGLTPATSAPRPDFGPIGPRFIQWRRSPIGRCGDWARACLPAHRRSSRSSELRGRRASRAPAHTRSESGSAPRSSCRHTD